MKISTALFAREKESLKLKKTDITTVNDANKPNVESVMTIMP